MFSLSNYLSPDHQLNGPCYLGNKKHNREWVEEDSYDIWSKRVALFNEFLGYVLKPRPMEKKFIAHTVVEREIVACPALAVIHGEWGVGHERMVRLIAKTGDLLMGSKQCY